MKIKICFAIPTVGAGGSEKILISLVKNLSKNFLPLIWVWQAEGGLKKEIKRAKIPYFFSSSLLRAMKILRAEEIDLFDSWSYAIPFRDILVAKMVGISKIIHTRHSLGFWRKKKDFFDLYLERKWVKQFIAVSEAIKNDLVEAEKILPAKIAVIPNFLDLKTLKEINPEKIRKKYQLGKNEKIIGNISNFHPIKGLEYFLEAVALVRKKAPLLSLKFLLVGKGALEKKIKAKAKKLKIEKDILLLKNISDFREIVPCFDILVSTSLSEGFGLTILEGWAFKKPVVFTKCGGPEEVINDGRNGFLVEKKNALAAADKIILLLKNPSLAEKIGQAGRKKLEKKYNPEKAVRAYEKIYEQVYQTN